MYSEENIGYLAKTRGVERVQRMLYYIEKGKEPDNFKEKKELFKVKKSLEAMEKYGENHWWESSNYKIVVAYQLEESVLLVPVSRLILAINTVFKTNIQTEQELLEKLPEIKKIMKTTKVS